MTKTEIEELKTNLQSYLESHGIDTSTLFRCVNPDHTDNNPSMEYFKDNKVYCYGCRVCYDLFGAISAMENVDRSEAIKRAINYYTNGYMPKTYKQKPKDIRKAENGTPKDYTKAYEVWKNNFSKNENAKNYLINRGIDLQTAERFNVGFNTFKFGDIEFNSVIIPSSKNCFTARNIDTNCDSKNRHYRPTGCQSEIFNVVALKNDIPYCVITEGEFDCLSFETIGVNAIALGGAYNISKLKNAEKDKSKTLILALDNDERGKLTTEELIAYFKENNFKYLVFDNCGFKDANQALIEDKERFENSIKELIQQLNKKLKTQENEM